MSRPKPRGRNRCLIAILAELAAAGIKPVVDASGKHLKVRWRQPGKSPRLYVLGRTPSDNNAHRNARAEIRRMLKTGGA